MPKYRQLHLKIIDSFDFNEMPDDFTRASWMLLSLIVDSEGRGIDNMAWVRAKMYPLREDVSIAALAAVFDWLETRKMILRYAVGGKRFFLIVNFKLYQTGLEKEAKSTIPEPPQSQARENNDIHPEEVPTSSGEGAGIVL